MSTPTNVLPSPNDTHVPPNIVPGFVFVVLIYILPTGYVFKNTLFESFLSDNAAIEDELLLIDDIFAVIDAVFAVTLLFVVVKSSLNSCIN